MAYTSTTTHWRIGLSLVLAVLALLAFFPGEVLSFPNKLPDLYRRIMNKINQPFIADGYYAGTFRVRVEAKNSHGAIAGATITAESRGYGTRRLGEWVSDASGVVEFPLGFGVAFDGNRWGKMNPSYQLVFRAEAPGYASREINETNHLRSTFVPVVIKMQPTGVP